YYLTGRPIRKAGTRRRVFASKAISYLSRHDGQRSTIARSTRVTRFLFSLGLLIAFAALGQADSDGKDSPDEPKPPYTQPQSPPLPAPKGLTFIDQGIHD